jgi:hypothetical protein
MLAVSTVASFVGEGHELGGFRRLLVFIWFSPSSSAAGFG